MNDERNLITVFFAFIFVISLVLIFPNKANQLFSETFYLLSLVVVLILIFFYFWLKFNRY